MEDYSYLGEIPENLLFMARNPQLFIVRLICWISTFALLFFATLLSLRAEDTPEDIFELIGIFGQSILPWIVISVFIISYREAKGNLKGIANEQHVWMQWYHRQQETISSSNTFEESPPSENRQMDSYFKIAQKTILFMVRNPISIIVHLICWFAGSIFAFYEIFGSVMFFVVIILALISSYQEAKGVIKGTAKEGEAWTKWYHRQTEAKVQGYTLAEVLPSLKTT